MFSKHDQTIVIANLGSSNRRSRGKRGDRLYYKGNITEIC